MYDLRGKILGDYNMKQIKCWKDMQTNLVLKSCFVVCDICSLKDYKIEGKCAYELNFLLLE